MSVEVSVAAAKKNLEEILSKLLPGETATLISLEGKPMAVLVPLKSSEDAAKVLDWDAEWETLAREIDLDWKSKKSALEILTEMRR
jgi:antitoxin (DNA-binding transcriptional repressor) of toxin-antitoxin stability system